MSTGKATARRLHLTRDLPRHRIQWVDPFPVARGTLPVKEPRHSFTPNSLPGCRGATAGVSADPDPSEQVAGRLWGGRGRHRLYPPPWKKSLWLLVWTRCPPSFQAVCCVFDKSVRTLLHDFGPMVAQLSRMLGQIYDAYPQPAALDLTRQVCHLWLRTCTVEPFTESFVVALTDSSHICSWGSTHFWYQKPHWDVDHNHAGYISAR